MQRILTGFTLIGDSNVRRNVTSSVTADRPLMSDAQIIPSGRLSSFAAALESTRAESNACVVSCVSNYLSTSPPGSSTSARIDKVISDFFSKIQAFCVTRPSVQVFVCPPMYRTSPLWYRDSLPEMLVRFSASSSGPANLHMMPSFPRPVLETDGVHLTPFSGMEFIVHLFKVPESIMSSLDKDLTSHVSVLDEGARELRDRVQFLELDHKRLSDKFEHREAVDAELRDYEENLRNECFFMIRGLNRLPKLDPKEWQSRAVADVSKVLSIMGFDYPIKYIQNATGRGKNSVVHYKVRVQSAEVSKMIREKFSSYFHDRRDSRPPELASISIRNCVTSGTLGRMAIMQLLGKRYTDSNPGSRYTVIGYEARPLLKLFPSQDASDKRVMTFNFIEAISKLPTCFTSEETSGLLKRISPRLHTCLREVFVVVTQDALRRAGPRSQARSTESTANTSASDSSPSSGPSRGSKKRRAPAAASGPSAKK